MLPTEILNPYLCGMQHFVDVILPLPLEKHFTYSVTGAEAGKLQPGMRVAVPFGKTKVYTGIVSKLHQTPPQIYQAKPIEQVLDEEPTVTHIQLKFWKWIAEYYLCWEGDVLRAALPGAFLLESETVIELNKSVKIDLESLKDDELLVYEALQNQSLMKIREVMDVLDKKSVMPVINRLSAKNAVVVNQEIYQQYKPKLVRYIRLMPEFSNEGKLRDLLEKLKNAHKQRQVILSFFSLSSGLGKRIKAKELQKKSGATSTTIKSLIDKGILEEYHLKTDRVVSENPKTLAEISFNEHQQKAFSEINEVFEKTNVCLLHGVTSSGKTEIYTKQIEQALSKGKQVLYLLPEIALTTQLISRMRNYFGNEVLVYHSKYSVNERVEVYRHVLHGIKGKIIIGARSSILLPFKDLGLIIIDEEHEPSFKQFDPAPRYHARDSAVVLASSFGAKVLMGSATPSLESYYNAIHGKYGLVTLSERFGNVLPPEIELVDIKEKQRKKRMTGHFSDRMLEEIKRVLKNEKQVILFQNRRGFSPILECQTCGHSPQCPNCDVSLTYHRGINKLRCHYCGYHIAMQSKCMACGSHELTTKGFGTEQIETELKALFPDNKIGRMDLDTTRGKHGYEKIINAFENREMDILVGTQMLTKGLDFRNVDLVGVMNADSLLNFPDFRAYERCFHLLVQVAGRAGRTKDQGKVLIQTYNPNYPVFRQVVENDYEAMYKNQMEDRHHFNYPPIYRLIKLSFKSRDYNKINEASEWFARMLRQSLGGNVLGPEFPPIARIRNEYHKNILVKIPPKQSLQKTKDYIKKAVSGFRAVADFSRVKIVVNVDPY